MTTHELEFICNDMAPPFCTPDLTQVWIFPT
uniref:Uncharacterized protein n=1 Tax=Arundo donax TaxID=35708 RepID=A0A0A9BBH6_ARUDO